MKILAAATAVSALLQLTTAQLCSEARDGAPCKTSGGASSRCYDDTCRTVPKLCPAGASPLQACEGGGFCLSFVNPKELSCLQEKEVGRFMNYDSCEGKADGATCTSFYFEGSAKGSAALYEEQGICLEHFCMPPAISVCYKKDHGSPCTFQGIVGANNAEFSGACEVLPEKLGRCDFKTTTRHGRATPRMAFDNRPGAKASGNVSAVDVCDQLNAGMPCFPGNVATRCFDKACRAAPPTCPTTAKVLEKCSSGDSKGVCFGMGLAAGNASAKSTPPGGLLCLDPKEIVVNYKYDACEGKKDGDDCDDLQFEVDSEGRNTLYETTPGKCRGHRCMSAGIVACAGKSRGSPCQFRDVKEGDLMDFSGTCVEETGMEPTCDGHASVQRDTVGKAKVRMQGPEGEKKPTTAPSSGSGSKSSASSTRNRTPVPTATTSSAAASTSSVPFPLVVAAGAVGTLLGARQL